MDGVPEVSEEMSDNCPMIIERSVFATVGARSRCGDLDLVKGSDLPATSAPGTDGTGLMGTSPSGVHCCGSEAELMLFATALAFI